ncbi:MAG TPA: ACT domain-containing protein [Candidatus Thermoplasmatota archaeon]|nr:ACT domain-containing protein [Candidatus Thermoplasmatota archaeon]
MPTPVATPTTLTFRVEDRPGALGRAARLLANAGINIEAFQADAGTVRFLVQDGTKAANALRAGGFPCQTAEALPVRIPNRPGELATLGEALGRASVNIQASFGSADAGTIYLQVDNVNAARPVIERLAGAVPAGSGTLRNR